VGGAGPDRAGPVPGARGGDEPGLRARAGRDTPAGLSPILQAFRRGPPRGGPLRLCAPVTALTALTEPSFFLAGASGPGDYLLTARTGKSYKTSLLSSKESLNNQRTGSAGQWGRVRVPGGGVSWRRR